MITYSPAHRALVATLAAVLRRRCRGLTLAARPAWTPYPLRVLDAALATGLDADRVTLHGEAYRTNVAARVEAFAEAHPGVRTLADLRARVAAFPAPPDFARHALGGADPRRGAVVLGLTDGLLRWQHVYSEAPGEAERLAAWAVGAVGDDLSFLDVGGGERFRRAGFQYLRLLFGAPVLVPGVHLDCFVAEVAGPRAGIAPAEELVGEAAAEASLPLLAVDRLLRTDRARGHAWRPVLEDIERLLAAYAETRRLDADAVVRLHERAAGTSGGAEHAARGDYLAATNALAPYPHDGPCFADLAAAYLRACYDVLMERHFDAEVTFALAHQHTVRLLRHLRDDARPPATAALVRRLGALVRASARHVMPRDRRAP